MPEARYYLDFTGTGNSLNASNPETARLIVDSLRYWVAEMHVDGFRFDLATTLGRASPRRSSIAHAPIFQIIDQDPVLSRVKLIAEPWDTGTRRLPGRQLPGAVRASGTASTATPCAATGRATRTWRRRSATA